MILSLEITTKLAFTRNKSFLAVVWEELSPDMWQFAVFVARHTHVALSYSWEAGLDLRINWEM